MQGILHYQKTDEGFIVMKGDLELINVDSTKELIVTQKQFSGEVISEEKLLNGPFNISKYFPGYDGQVYITAKHPKRFEFVGSGPLKKYGKIL